LIFCALVVALTLPIESVLLQAVSTSDPKDAARQWAAGLSTDSLDRAADQIRAYPQMYRRAIMRAATPVLRSQVWRGHIGNYLQTHPDLDVATVALLQAAVALASPENLSAPTAEAQAQVRTVGDAIQAALGKEDAEYVLYRLGPRDGTFASLEPTSLILANWVRSKFVALAMSTRQCDCKVSWGCDGFFTYCKDNTGCPIQEDWPACGWLWNETCDGLCAGVFNG
jgi:hypothetical protein